MRNDQKSVAPTSGANWLTLTQYIDYIIKYIVLRDYIWQTVEYFCDLLSNFGELRNGYGTTRRRDASGGILPSIFDQVCPHCTLPFTAMGLLLYLFDTLTHTDSVTTFDSFQNEFGS